MEKKHNLGGARSKGDTQGVDITSLSFNYAEKRREALPHRLFQDSGFPTARAMHLGGTGQDSIGRLPLLPTPSLRSRPQQHV